jgi:hypothetical protein
VLRAGLLRLGGAMLGEALSADPGHRGPRANCGHGHEAVFAGYREKVIDTVLGPVALRRAWYHCADCGHGLAPRDDELGVAGTSMSPGLAAMNDLAAAAGPFAGAARLLEKLAGVRLTARRVEPRAARAPGSSPPGRWSLSRRPRCPTSSAPPFMPRGWLCRTGRRWRGFVLLSGPAARSAVRHNFGSGLGLPFFTGSR